MSNITKFIENIMLKKNFLKVVFKRLQLLYVFLHIMTNVFISIFIIDASLDIGIQKLN